MVVEVVVEMEVVVNVAVVQEEPSQLLPPKSPPAGLNFSTSNTTLATSKEQGLQERPGGKT